MKTSFNKPRLWLLGLACALLAFGAHARAELGDGLVAYWAFEGDYADSWGDFHGEPRGVEAPTFVVGVFGSSAIRLNGEDQYVEITGGDENDLEFPGGDMSISGWFRVASFDTSWQAIISKGEGTTYRVARRGETDSISYAGGVDEASASAPNVNDGEWHHFVAISDSTTSTRLWVDGVMYEETTAPPVLAETDLPLLIGENPSARNREWEGDLDEFAIWNRVLTDSEVGQLFNVSLGDALALNQASIVEGLVAHWNFDDNYDDPIGGFTGEPRGTDAPMFVPSVNPDFGSSISLNGEDQYVEIVGGDENDLEFPEGDMSISGWFRVAAFDTNWQALISKGEGTNYRVARRADTGSIAYAGGVREPAAAAPNVNDGAWHHFVAISDSANGVQLWIDGVLAESGTTPPILGESDLPLLIGENPGSAGRVWEGEIDDVAIWNRVLTENEIGQLANNSIDSIINPPQVILAPVIIDQPQSQTATIGSDVTFSVTATGTSPLNYQWLFNANPIFGATNDVRTVLNAQADNAGNYDVVVSNASGSVTSESARLTLCLPMINFSFEADAFTTLPGYVHENAPITGWSSSVGRSGINPVAGSNPFADNGAIPDGNQVAFMQEEGALSQMVGGFTVGAQYYVQYYENARDCCGAVPFLEVTIGGDTIVSAHAVSPVGSSNSYHHVTSSTFTATATSLELAFIKSNPQGGDTTALIDNVCIVQSVPQVNLAPVIIDQPRSQTATIGSDVIFSVTATGTSPLNYQWLFNANPIFGATNIVLKIFNAREDNAGIYDVVVSNARGSVTSEQARLAMAPNGVPQVASSYSGDGVSCCWDFLVWQNFGAPAYSFVTAYVPAGVGVSSVSGPGNSTWDPATRLIRWDIPGGLLPYHGSEATVQACFTGLGAGGVTLIFQGYDPSPSQYPQDVVIGADGECPADSVDPDLLCPDPTVVGFSAGTVEDDFDGPEAASPSAGLLLRLGASGAASFKGFDDCAVNTFFAHTFTDLPSCITGVTLHIRLRACGSKLDFNDTFVLGFTDPSGELAPPIWGRYLGNGNPNGPGLFNTSWAPGTTYDIVLDLSKLPNVDSTTTDLIPDLNAQGFLDLIMEDDSAIDFAVLTVTSCCCETGPELVENGSFEVTHPVVAVNDSNNFLDLLTGVPGWTTTSGNFLEVWSNNVGFLASDGVNQLEINAQSHDQTVSQVITNLSTECETTFSFDYTGRFGDVGGTPNNDFIVTLSGGHTLSMFLNPAAHAVGGWTNFSVNFVPTSPTITIEFKGQPHFSDGTSATQGGAHIDNVSLTQCCDPEPCITVICPDDIVVDCEDERGAFVTYSVPTATSDCCPGPVTVSCDPPEGLFPIGVTPVTCTAVDSCGNTVICTFTVTVRGHGPGQWSWAERAGGDAMDSGNSVAVDHEGNVFVTGSYTSAMNFPSGITLTGFGGTDIFLAKYDRLGAVLWAVRAGGVGQDTGYGVAVDDTGNAYVTGEFTRLAAFESYPGTHTFNLNSKGGDDRDIFVAKYSPSGTCLWAVRDGDTGNDRGACIAVRPDGSAVFVTGNWSVTTSGQVEAFVLKLAGSSGLGGPPFISSGASGQSAQGRAIDLDPVGNAYVTGVYAGPVTTFSGVSLPATAGGAARIFVARFNGATLTCDWAKHSGNPTATGNHDGTGIAVDPSGDFCYVTAYFNGTANFGVSSIVTNNKASGLYDYLIAKFNLQGTPIWAIKGGGDPNTDQETRGIAVDPDGNPCVTGFIHPNAPNPFINEGPTVLVASYSGTTGNPRWTRNAIDGNAGPTPNAPQDIGMGIAVDQAGCLHVTGAFTEDLEFPSIGQPVATLYSIPDDARDMFVAKLCPICGCDENQNLVVNGSFEQPVSGGASVHHPSAQVPGWNGFNGNCESAIATTIELWRGDQLTVGQQDLNQHLEISSTIANQTVCQTVTDLTPGCPTTLCFWYTGRPGTQFGVPFDNAFTVTLSGAFELSETLNPASFPAPSPATEGWYSYCRTFIPSGSTLTISFSRKPTTGDVGGAHIDNVSLTQNCCDTEIIPSPVIIDQPRSQTATIGSDVTFSVTTTGTPPLSYQWRFNDTNIPGATDAAYTIINARAVNAGIYDVVVSNANGSVISAPAWLMMDSLSTGTCDPGKVIWVDMNGTGIYRADLDGANPQLVYALNSSVNIPSPGGEAVAVDPATGDIYFGDNSTTPGKVMKADSTGANPVVVTTTPAGGLSLGWVNHIAVGGGMVYWVDWSADKIYRAIEGGAPNLIVNLSHVVGLALDLRPAVMKLYYFDSFGNVYRADLNGGNQELLYNFFGMSGFALDTCNDKIYMIAKTTPHPGVPVAYIACANLTDGSDFTTILSGDGPVGIWGDDRVVYIALDTPNQRMYWSSHSIAAGKGQIKSADMLTGNNITVIATSSNAGASSNRGVALCLPDYGCPTSPTAFANKDFHNNTGQTVDGIEWLVQGQYSSVISHYDGPYPGEPNSIFSSFAIVPAGANTLLRWSGGASIPNGGKAHVGFTVDGASLTTLGASWTIGGVYAGCVHQVSIGEGFSHATGEVVFLNTATACESQVLYAGNITLEWFSTMVPLAELSVNGVRRPLRADDIPSPPIAISPGGSASVKVPFPPIGARFAMIRYTVSASPTLTGPGNTIDYQEVQLQSLTEGLAITGQPQSQTATKGSDVSFGVTATGTPPLSYQWRFNDNPIFGATNIVLTIVDAGEDNEGIYDVVVSDANSSVTSAQARLTVKDKFTMGQNADGTLSVSWPPDEGWILQESINLLGPWSNSTLQSSPVKVAPSGKNRFFRLVKP